MSKSASIGIDVGGTKTLVVLFDKQFNALEQIKTKTVGDDKEKFSATLLESVEALERKARKAELKVSAIGVGFAGSVDMKTGAVVAAPNLPALEAFPFEAVLSKVSDAKVVLSNDANAGLYGEFQLGAAVGTRHVVGVFIGTGIGAAIIIDGKLYVGSNGVAGDLGHYLLQPLAPLSGSEQQGTLDDIASRTAISGEAATLALKYKAPHLLKIAGTDVKNIRGASLAEAIQEGDDQVEELVRSRCHVLGIVLSNVVDFLNPDMVVLGGGLTEAIPNIIRKEVQDAIDAHTTAAARAGFKVVTAKLKGHAVAAGAAKLAMEAA